MWQQLKAVIVLPFTAAVVVPTLVLYQNGVGRLAYERAAPWNVLTLVAAAVSRRHGSAAVRVDGGLVRQGRPGDFGFGNPPQHLVVVGPYRHVRNPMISGVLFILPPRPCSLHRFRCSPGWPSFCWSTLIYIPLLRGARSREAVRGGIPPLPEQRASLDPSSDAVAGYFQPPG